MLYIILPLLALLVFGIINFYIGLRTRQALASYLPFLNWKLCWLVFFLVAFSYIIARFGTRLFPAFIVRALETVGGYWLAAMLYLFILAVLVDLVRLLDRWLHFLPEVLKSQSGMAAVGASAVLLVLALTVYGSWSAHSPRVMHYDIHIDKKAGSMDQLHVVMLSDIHLHSGMSIKRIDELVERVNLLQPDVILIVGDLMDDDVTQFGMESAIEAFRRLKADFGVYAVMGNHEYYSGHPDKVSAFFAQAGMKLLRDSSVKIADAFYLIGREDLSVERYHTTGRKSMEELMKDVDRSFPVLVMDHQPYRLYEPQEAGVDLQLSGHTHRGQMFPLSLITDSTYEVDWGHLQKEDFQIIVSSGYGFWGPPVRIGSRSEIVDITIHFTGK